MMEQMGERSMVLWGKNALFESFSLNLSHVTKMHQSATKGTCLFLSGNVQNLL